MSHLDGHSGDRHGPAPRRLFVGLGLVLAAASVACGLLTPDATPPPPTASAMPPTSEPVLAPFDGSDASFQALNEALATNPAAVLAEADRSLASPDAETRFPAVYALGLIVDADTADILRPVLHDPDLVLRTIAAGSLIGLGEPDSLPVLIEALDSDEPLPFSHPPRPLWALADIALAHYTGIDIGVAPGGEDQRLEAAAAWRAWWQENRAALTWDGSQWRVGP